MIKLCSIMVSIPDPPETDLIVFAGFSVLSLAAWRHEITKDHSENVPCVQERSLAAQTSLSAVTGTITASAILLGFITLFTQVGADFPQFESLRLNAAYAAAFAITSVIIAAWTLGVIPTYVTKSSTVRLFSIALLSQMMLFWMVAAGIRFGYAFSLLLYPECLCGVPSGPPSNSPYCGG